MGALVGTSFIFALLLAAAILGSPSRTIEARVPNTTQLQKPAIRNVPSASHNEQELYLRHTSTTTSILKSDFTRNSDKKHRRLQGLQKRDGIPRCGILSIILGIAILGMIILVVLVAKW